SGSYGGSWLPRKSVYVCYEQKDTVQTASWCRCPFPVLRTSAPPVQKRKQHLSDKIHGFYRRPRRENLPRSERRPDGEIRSYLPQRRRPVPVGEASVRFLRYCSQKNKYPF